MAKQNYIPINLSKYSGSFPIELKSSWEYEFAHKYCDINPLCLEWAYESWRIPYNNPLNGKQTIYIPDFLVSFISDDKSIRTCLVEIKPLHETLSEHARGVHDQEAIIKNMAKWQAAIKWCERRNNIEFVILTEAQLFPEEIKPARKTQIKRPPPFRPHISKRRVKKS